MDNQIKRRLFLGSIVGTLIALPLGVRYFTGGRSATSHWNFGKELKRYQAMFDLPVNSVSGPASFRLPLAPQPDREWTYVLFSPSHLPNEMSQASGGEPDAFVIREGWVAVDKTQADQTIIHGGDEISKICTATWTEDRNPGRFALMLHDGKLLPAKEKGTKADPGRDTQFEHLLSLRGVPNKDLNVGTRWKADSGRITPFKYQTDYEVAGFAEIAGRKTVDIRFSANIPNLAGRPGVNKKAAEKGETMTNTHNGHAYFDLETGLLVRQEVEMTSTCTGIKGVDKALAVNAKFYVQLFDV